MRLLHPSTCATASALLLCACPAPDTPALSGGGPTDTSESSTGDASTSDGADVTTAEPQPICGDEVVEANEECDDGDANANDAGCKLDCTLAFCGDGLVHEGVEACDDGNTDDDDGCRSDCTIPPFCGDGVIGRGEECDDGDANANDAACRSDCTAAFCGDGVVHTGVEQCDDGNEENEDACTQVCAPPYCGDGFAQIVNSELCDDGDAVEGDECNADCTTAGLWTHTYNGASDNNDEIHGVTCDSAGNVIVAGETFAGAQGDDVWVRKYDHDGNELWTQTFHGVTADVGYAVAAMANDHVVVGGSTFTLDDGRDAWLRRYAPDGSTAWTQTFDGTSHDHDEIHGVAIDPTGNVLVAGYTTTAAGQRDVWVRKYSGAGVAQWTRTATGTGGQNDEGHAIASDSMGNVIVTGYVWGGASSRDLWVRKYDSAGNEQWTRTHDGPASNNDEGFGVAADSAGNVIVTGYETTDTVGPDVWVRKYDPDGDELWTSTYNAPQDGYDVGRAVTVDGDDAVIVAGSIFRGSQSDNIWVRKYDSDGNELWTSTYNSDGFGIDVANAVATDPDGNVAVGGFENRTDLGEFRNAWIRLMLQ
ncbi:SBBP repeat-containing protein [Paraliomyxa miuraensis]|uniref:SBBP repeat-containing protein n=1 Tax=Paraliomyxa miuraensis TaxID=376150 RepID=UPI002258592C|nr:SBBP repeat-containing protein [Paraliomyxa miuraensis]MCX4247489.1 DUF4215 domain-containing protein [Paraliomyxa miuraensis]